MTLISSDVSAYVKRDRRKKNSKNSINNAHESTDSQIKGYK